MIIALAVFLSFVIIGLNIVFNTNSAVMLMSIFFIAGLFLAAIQLIHWLGLQSEKEDNDNNKNICVERIKEFTGGKIMRKIHLPYVIFAIIGIILLFSGFTFISPGYVGVVMRLEKPVAVYENGVHLKIPVIDTVKKLNIRDTKYDAKFDVSSKDVQTISVFSSLVCALNPNFAKQVYLKYGDHYIETLVNPLWAEVVNSVIANYPIEEFVEKKPEISAKIKATLEKRMTGSGIELRDFLITNHDFSDEYDKAVESKKVAEQGALKAKYDLERVTLEAEAQKRKQASLTQHVLQEKAIDKWDGKLPMYYSGGQLPFISGAPIKVETVPKGK